MDSDKDDLAVLCRDMTKEEVDRVHRLLHEWSIGPEDSFPVQFVLLTRAQLRAAASMPRAVTDSRKWLEQHLAEYRRQTEALLDGFSNTTGQHTAELKTAVELHAKTTEQAAGQIQAQLDDAEAVANRVKSLMDNAASQWKDIKAGTAAQCELLELISNDLQDRFAWRVMLRSVAWFLLALGYGICIGHFWIH